MYYYWMYHMYWILLATYCSVRESGTPTQNWKSNEEGSPLTIAFITSQPSMMNVLGGRSYVLELLQLNVVQSTLKLKKVHVDIQGGI